MIRKVLDRLRRGTAATAVAAIAGATTSPVLSRDRGKDERGDEKGDAKTDRDAPRKRDDQGEGDGDRSERLTASAGQRDRDRDGTGDRDRDRQGSQEERQRSRESSSDEEQTSRDARRSDEDDGDGDGDLVGGRVGEAAERLRRRGERLTGADGGGDADEEDDIAVSVDPATDGLEIETDNISFIRDDDGAITIDTDNIFFERGPEPETTLFPTPGIPAVPEPTPRPDGGDNDTDMVS